MGCDGGTIPKRDELVRKKKRAEQKDKVAQRSFLWRHCNISQTPLHDPVVACGLGRLYNKDSLILALLDKTLLPETAGHIKSLKDVKELKLTQNPSYEASIDKGDQYVDHQSSPYICPVIGHEMNGNFKFCFSWGCGCVVSERAMKQLKSNLCHKCQSPVAPEDIVVLNPADEDLDLMKSRMEARQAKIKAEKKSKKIKQEIKEEVDTDSTKPTENGCSSSSGIIPKVEKTVTVKIEKNGFKRPAEGNLSMKNEDFKKTKSEYSVAKDPNASTVYKSLFTSSSIAQNQMKAHWITYNPFYN
ncbi:replication termination factor 2 [Halyomorpha halys]|uniref:replication termination factor 2 n=1 Tax=Halyomorpha halys TaxID=286706 RepID=UPI0006D4F751|nr:protein RTF2 homolog [Halyomorpha halys]